MDKLLLDIPTHIETERLYLRCYQPGDGQWYYAMSQKNHAHLSRYESNNILLTIKSEADAEAVVQGLAAAWVAHGSLFMGAFDKQTDAFVAQIYGGTVSWDAPEVEIGYFVDQDQEGQGYVTEAVQAMLRFLFEHLSAHRVRIECDDTNRRSYRVAERCGMVREGHIRENKQRAGGVFSGTLHYGLLRSEYETK